MFELLKREPSVGAGDEGGASLAAAVNTATLSLVADLANLALFSQDAAGRIRSWSNGAARISGHPEDEMIGGTLSGLVPAHLHADLTSLQHRVAAGERVEQAFLEIRRRDGLPVPIALSMTPVHDEGGAFLGAVAVAIELTETRLAQAALAEVEQRLRDWEALAHVGRWLWDVGTGTVQWSDELHRMHGIVPRDFEGTLDAHLAVMHPEDQRRVRARLEEAVRTCQPFEDEYRTGDECDVRWFAMRAEPEIGSSGEVVGLRGITQDITMSAARR